MPETWTPAPHGLRKPAAAFPRLGRFAGGPLVPVEAMLQVGLVAEDTVHAGDGLHKGVALHGFARILRLQAGSVKTGQPHVVHDNDQKRVFRIIELRI